MSTSRQRRRISKGRIVEDGIEVIAVIGGQIVDDRRIRLELVGNRFASARSIFFVDIGAVRVESEPIGQSQTRARLEWGRNIICVESGGWVVGGVNQGISEGGMRQRWIGL